MQNKWWSLQDLWRTEGVGRWTRNKNRAAERFSLYLGLCLFSVSQAPQGLFVGWALLMEEWVAASVFICRDTHVALIASALNFTNHSKIYLLFGYFVVILILACLASSIVEQDLCSWFPRRASECILPVHFRRMTASQPVNHNSTSHICFWWMQ